RLLLGLAAAYIGVSLTLGGTRAAVPVFQLLAGAWVLVTFIFHCGLAWRIRPAASGPPTSPRAWRGFRILELMTCNIVLTLVLAELALRGFAALGGGGLVIRAALDDHLLVPEHDYGGGLRGNRLGYPGRDFSLDKRRGVMRIAALGDSFALGPAVPFADNYLTLLQTRMSAAEVYNFGVSGAGPREYLAVLRRDVWTYQPDLVLVSMFGGNDVTEALPAPRDLDPRGHSLYLLAPRGWRLLG